MACWSIVTSDKEKADRIFKNVITAHNSKVIRHVCNINRECVYFEDGNWLIKLLPSESARGYRHTKMWIDKEIPRDVANAVFLTKFIGDKKDIVWI